MTLYTTHRPVGFDAVIGQDSVISNLKNALETNKVSHSMIFSGPRGTGKTTTARIVAGGLGAQPYDVMEVDAASTRGIDDIREIRSASVLAPMGDARVYILDEAHQLTPPAWDALLKTLEEPPPRCYFILCTTTLGKVPPTVQSRCQVFTFRPAGVAELVELLERVIDAENVAVDDEVVQEIALHSHGSYRDALTNLDQLINSDDLSIDSLRDLLGQATAEDIYQLMVNTAQGNVADILEMTQELAENGADLGRLVTSLLDLTRRCLVGKYVQSAPDLDRELAAMLGEAKIFELADSLARAADVASRAGNVRLALEAALCKAAA